VTGSCEVIS
jgi:hypothetical protein